MFFEGPSRVAGREALASLAPDEFPRARLRFVPALRLLSLEHPVHEPWREALRGEEPRPARPSPTHLAVWRAGQDVLHAPLDGNEGTALRAALAGASLLDVCARFAAVDEPATAGFVALSSWIDEGWVSAVQPA